MMAAVTWIEVICFVFCDLKATTCTGEANIIVAMVAEEKKKMKQGVEQADGETADTAFILATYELCLCYFHSVFRSLDSCTQASLSSSLYFSCQSHPFAFHCIILFK